MVSFEEFKIVMIKEIYKNMCSLSDIMEDIKSEFKRVDIDNCGYLNTF